MAAARKVPPRHTHQYSPTWWADWEPHTAAFDFHGFEITRADEREPAAFAGQTTHRRDFAEPVLPPCRRRERPAPLPHRPFLGASAEGDAYGWPIPAQQPELAPPAVGQNVPPPAWPVVSYHGAFGEPGIKAFKDAVIEEEEARAWRQDGKTLPERAIFHGEDESRAVGRDPLSRAGGYPTRGRAPQRNGSTEWTRKGTGSSYAWPRAGKQVQIKWRQHDRARPPAKSAPAPEAASASRQEGQQARSRRDDFRGSEVGELFRPQSAPPTECERVKPHGAGLVSAKAWRAQQAEKARAAMPGGAREAAREGRRDALPAGSRGWVRPGRSNLTGAGREPLKVGEAAPRGTGKLNAWHLVAAKRYK